MQEFLKTYIQIVGVLLIFTGFWYVEAYFSFFGMGEVVAELSIQYIAQHSFVILFEILNFDARLYCIPSIFLWGCPR